jgi:serine/threonine protein kinase
MRPSSGLTFGGRYQLSSRVAIGGMGEVWEATDLIIGRTVAIKILKDEYLGDPGFLERFRAEARHAALVNHEGIANVFDYGEEDGSAFLVMELVPGEALSTFLERERVLPADRVLDIVVQTASALEAAHQAGLVHRDIKPGNLLITPDGRVKITDFGIARIADQVPLTATGQVMGTVQYLSPEQASGHSASASTDIYSLGIVAYESLAGRRPFTGESQVAIAMAQIHEPPPELPVKVAEPVRNLVYACLAKKPEDRPLSAAHLARAAQALRRGDLASAAAAVPTIAADDAFAAIGAPSDAPAATRLLPVNGTPLPAVPSGAEHRRRNPWTWPLIAIVSVLVVALVAIIIVLTIRPTGDGAPPMSPSSSSGTPTPTPSVSTSAPSTTVLIDVNDYKGRPYDEVRDEIIALGFGVNQAAGPAAPEPSLEGTVSDLNPSGNLTKGTEITVRVYGPFPTPPAPTTATAPAGPYLFDAEVTVSFPTYSDCPAGHPLANYTFLLDNATFTSDSNPVSAEATELSIRLGAPGEAKVTYVANCGSHPVPSAPSGILTIVVS